tara:strand:- start:203 stop:493 length:291 start_codon:yes stop_codon:yes gene_type:complete
MRIFKLLFLIIIALLGVSFSCLNASFVKINLYVATYDMHLSILIVLILGIGILIGCVAMSTAYLRLKAENLSIKSKVKWADKEISNLRALPIKNKN